MSKSQRHLFFGLTAIVALALLLFIGYRFGSQLEKVLHLITNHQELVRVFQHHTPTDLITYTLLMLICFWLPGAPVAVLAIAAGVCFGHWTAFVMNVTAMTVGNFTVANLLPEIMHTPKNRFSQKLYADLLKIRHPSIGLILGYAIPFIPSTVVNLAAKQLIPARGRLAGICLLGSLPSAFLYAFGGDAALRGNWLHVAIVIGVAVLLLGLLWVIHHDHKRLADRF